MSNPVGRVRRFFLGRMVEEGERITIEAKFRDQKINRKHEGRVVSFTLAHAGRTAVAYVFHGFARRKRR